MPLFDHSYLDLKRDPSNAKRLKILGFTLKKEVFFFLVCNEV